MSCVSHSIPSGFETASRTFSPSRMPSGPVPSRPSVTSLYGIGSTLDGGMARRIPLVGELEHADRLASPIADAAVRDHAEDTREHQRDRQHPRPGRQPLAASLALPRPARGGL